MTVEERVTIASAMSGESNTDVVSAYLSMARAAILNKMYPFHDYADDADVPVRYQEDQVQITVFLLNKRGAEGETAHNENGINRSYENGEIPASMLKRVTPFCKVVGGDETNENTAAESD